MIARTLKRRPEPSEEGARLGLPFRKARPEEVRQRRIGLFNS